MNRSIFVFALCQSLLLLGNASSLFAEEPVCGNGFLTSDEECDDGNTALEKCPYGADACEVCTPQCTVEQGEISKCGDGVVQDAYETCEPGDAPLLDCPYGEEVCEVCLPHCELGPGRVSFCGDGMIDNTFGEVCDPQHPKYLRCPYGDQNCISCDETCQFMLKAGAYCGDGIVQSEHEECDDSNNNTERCSADLPTCMVCNEVCQWEEGESSYCGDGNIDAAWGEVCDDGPFSGVSCPYGETCDYCNESCQWASAQGPKCGDSIIQTQMGETCDDGNGETESCPYGSTACLVCSASCQTQAGQTAYCGDFLLQGSLGEQCDQGSDNGAACAYGRETCIGCNASCQWASTTGPFCGDGEINGDESCDDGNATTERCDYNTGSCEVCNKDCQWETLPGTACGDGVVDVLEGESCDDGNTTTENCPYGHVSCTVCTEDCTWGNGHASFCGDGTHQPLEGESCDEGTQGIASCEYGDPSCVACAQNCRYRLILGPFCGDGITQTSQGESCDLGQEPPTSCPYGTPSCDTCSTECQKIETTGPFCGDGIYQEEFETCEHGIRNAKDCPYAANGAPSTCTICNGQCEFEEVPSPKCGDGMLDSAHGEACDDGNNTVESCPYSFTSCEVCDATCQWSAGTVAFCGDGQLSHDETCEDGNNVTETCSVEDPECNVCSTRCQDEGGRKPQCGDGIIDEPQEFCDDANENGAVDCPYGLTQCSKCTETCTVEAGSVTYCGDGVLQSDFETCEIGVVTAPTNMKCGSCSFECQEEEGWRYFVDPNEDLNDGCEAALWGRVFNVAQELDATSTTLLHNQVASVLTQGADEFEVKLFGALGDARQHVGSQAMVGLGTATNTGVLTAPRGESSNLILGHACISEPEYAGQPCVFDVLDKLSNDVSIASRYLESSVQGTPFALVLPTQGMPELYFMFPSSTNAVLEWGLNLSATANTDNLVQVQCSGDFQISSTQTVACESNQEMWFQLGEQWNVLPEVSPEIRAQANTLLHVNEAPLRLALDRTTPAEAGWSYVELNENGASESAESITWALSGDQLNFSFLHAVIGTPDAHWRAYRVTNSGPEDAAIRWEQCDAGLVDAGRTCIALERECSDWVVAAGTEVILVVDVHHPESCNRHQLFHANVAGLSAVQLVPLTEEEGVGLLGTEDAQSDNPVYLWAPSPEATPTQLASENLLQINAAHTLPNSQLLFTGPLTNGFTSLTLDHALPASRRLTLDACTECTSRIGVFMVKAQDEQ